MKRAKIMLMAIAVFGIVGGALAFKAKAFTEKEFFYYTTVNGLGECTASSPAISFLYKTVASGGFVTTYSAAAAGPSAAITTCTAEVTLTN